MPNLTHLKYLLEDACAHYVYSGYQLVCERGEHRINLFGGRTHYWPKSVDVSETTFFDLGSLTKVLFTTTIISRYLQSGILVLEHSVSRYVPAFKGSQFEKLTVLDLLCHRSGLAAWVPFFRSGSQGVKSSRQLMGWMLENQNSLCGVSSVPTYSDVGFWILGFVLESLGKPLEAQFNDEIRVALGLKCQFLPQGKAVAATEYCLWRNRLLEGEVFDENCAAMGGIGAHAGLFGSAQGIAPLAREWLKALRGESSYLDQKTAQRFSRRVGDVGDWAIGWDTRTESGSCAGHQFSRSSFGHLGYPGCSIWIDPLLSGFAIFLTNRVHPSRFDERIHLLRPLVHDEIALLWRAGEALITE